MILARQDARSALEAWAGRFGTLADAAAAEPGARPLRGRGRVDVVPAPPGPWPAETRWVVRRYRRGGALAAVLGDRYPRLGTPRPFREYGVLVALADAGIPAARPVGAAVYPSGPFYRGDLVTEWVAGSLDLARVLFDADQLDAFPSTPAVTAPERAVAAMAAAGRLVRRLHDAGLDHPDLNLKNILVTEGAAGPAAVVIDLDRAVLRPRLGDGPRRRMLRRFERSLRKWESRQGRAAPPGALVSFMRGYAEGG